MASITERLPSEILSRIFRIISDDPYEGPFGAKTIHALRLVSHRFKSIATAFLVKSVTVGLSTGSFLKLEELCRHPEFRLSIRHVRINVSFYDTHLAEDREYYCRHVGTTFYQLLERYERTNHKSRAGVAKVRKMWRQPAEIQNLATDQFDETSATPTQSAVVGFHKDYQRLTADQEELRRDNDHLRRLCEALAQLPVLETIKLDDETMERRSTFRTMNDGSIAPDDPRHLLFAIMPSMWKGSFETAYRTQQPLEMLGELLARLGRSNIRPRAIHIDLSVPANLSKFQISEGQAHDMHCLVSKVKDISIFFSHWARKGSLAENNDRSVAEMTALASVTRALTTTSTLETLHLDLQRYSILYQFPNVSTHELLPLQTLKWPLLHHLQLRHVPVDMDDLVLLTRSHRDTLSSLTMQSPFLRTGDWDEAIEHLAGLKRLEHVNILYPQGGRYGDRYNHYAKFPTDKANEYILGQSNENPLSATAEVVAS